MMTTTALAGLALTLSAGIALADWNDAKSRAFEYHDQYSDVPLAFEGELEMSTAESGKAQGCRVKVRHSGAGTEVLGTTPVPKSPESEQFCKELTEGMQSGSPDVSLSGAEVRAMIGQIDSLEVVPERTKSSRRSETYESDVDMQKMTKMLPPDMAQMGAVLAQMGGNSNASFLVKFAKPSGQLMNINANANLNLEVPQENIAIDGKVKATTEVGVLDGGQPYMKKVLASFNMTAKEGEKTENAKMKLQLSVKKVSKIALEASNRSDSIHQTSMDDAIGDLLEEPVQIGADFLEDFLDRHAN